MSIWRIALAMVGAAALAWGCALSEDVVEESSMCDLSEDCGCGERCVPDERGVRACVAGCETVDDCNDPERCDSDGSLECLDGECVPGCYPHQDRCGDECCDYGCTDGPDGPATACCQQPLGCFDGDPPECPDPGSTPCVDICCGAGSHCQTLPGGDHWCAPGCNGPQNCADGCKCWLQVCVTEDEEDPC